MIGKGNLLFVVPQLQIGYVIIDFKGCFIGFSGLLSLLSCLSPFLDLFRCLLRFAGEVSLVDLAAQDSSLRPVTSLNAKSYLFQNEFRLLPSGHRTKRLHLQFAENVGRGIEITLILLNIR